MAGMHDSDLGFHAHGELQADGDRRALSARGRRRIRRAGDLAADEPSHQHAAAASDELPILINRRKRTRASTAPALRAV